MIDAYLIEPPRVDRVPKRPYLSGWGGNDPLLWPTVGYLVLCIMFGGSSAAGFFGNAFLQFLGLIIIAALIVLRPSASGRRAPSPYILLGLLFVAIAAIQLIPLPPQIWRALGGRESIAREYELLGMSGDWAPISMGPQGTVRAIVSMLPPLAMAALVGRLTRPALPVLLRFFVASVAICAILGVLQIGTGKPYFYAITNMGKSVGFFANSNHQATLMLSMLPLAVAARRRPVARGSKKPVDATDLFLATSTILAAACAVGTQSLAAIGLLGFAVIGSYLMWLGDSLSSFAIVRRLTIALVLSLLILIGGAIFLSQVAIAASLDPAEGNRLVFARDTVTAIREYGSFGSGLGTFVDIYPIYQSVDHLSTHYVNHAHNDWLELALETGVLGVGLVVSLLVIFAHSILKSFRAPFRVSREARASVIAIIIIGLHSLVDYPLRTAAIGSIFGMLCGLLKLDRPLPRPK